MLSDLSVTVMIGAVALLLVVAVMVWMARGAQAGRLPLGGKVGLRTKATRRSPEAYLAGNRAAAPFVERYAVIVGALTGLSFLLTFVSDIAAAVVYVLALLFLALGVKVAFAKADAGARRVEGLGVESLDERGTVDVAPSTKQTDAPVRAVPDEDATARSAASPQRDTHED